MTHALASIDGGLHLQAAVWKTGQGVGGARQELVVVAEWCAGAPAGDWRQEGLGRWQGGPHWMPAEGEQQEGPVRKGIPACAREQYDKR